MAASSCVLSVASEQVRALAHLKDFVSLGTVAVIEGEHKVLEHLLGRLRLRLLRLVLGQGSVAVHDAVEARHVVLRRAKRTKFERS